MDPRRSSISPGLADPDLEAGAGNRRPLPPPTGSAFPSEVIDTRPPSATRWGRELPVGLEHMSFDTGPRLSTRRRLTYMRLAILIALGASAVLTVDLIRPGRAFCPLEQACAAASASVLGSIMGIPTAILGLGAFAALLLVTFFPVIVARRLLLPAGLFAGGVGLWLIVYQAFFLKSFCPLCVVVDTMAMTLGALILTWEGPAWGQRRWQDRESHSVAMAWLMVAALVVLAPFAWPRSEAPAWEQITPLTEADFADLPADAPIEDAPAVGSPDATGETAQPPAAPRDVASAPVPPVAARDEPPRESPSAPGAPSPNPAAAPPAQEQVVAPAASPVGEDQPAVVESEPVEPVRAAPAPVAPATPAAVPAVAPRKAILIVEYLNAYCRHCRATHKRLEEVLEAIDVPVRRRRIYTWASKEDPLWARACFFARPYRRENALFRELMKSSTDTPKEVYAAVERAGLDVRALKRHLAQPASAALVRNRRLMQSARLKGLPTFDIGRRRLLGEQSRHELRTAIQAAGRLLQN